jgi:hypothetical protein
LILVAPMIAATRIKGAMRMTLGAVATYPHSGLTLRA